MHTVHHRASGALSSAGFTLVEVIVVMTLMVVATMMTSSTIAGIARQRVIHRENELAVEGSRSLLENMRNMEISQIFALFNGDPSDDPGGPGTAPGRSFAIPGLTASPDDPDATVGEIRFPVVDVGPPGGPVDLELREDLIDRTFGTPRDLSGDSIIDGADHAADYYLLPVEILCRWRGNVGEREYRTFTMLCEFNWQ